MLIIGTLLLTVGMQLVLFGLLAEMIAFSYRRETDYSIVESSDEQEDRVLKTGKRQVGMSRGNLSE